MKRLNYRLFALSGVKPQRGVSLLFALMTLIALSLAAVALVRSVDTGTLVLGNLGFKQDTLLSADDASRRAIAWLNNRVGGTTLEADTTGYSASNLDALDPTGNSSSTTRIVVDWNGNSCADYASASYATCMQPSATETLQNGVEASWVITRLCSAAGAVTSSMNCASPMSIVSGESTERGEINYPNPFRIGPPAGRQYYRIVVRARGARNTVSYTETLVHF